MAEESKELTDKQRRFVDAYLGPLARGNATEAALTAGYKATKRESLAQQGSRLYRNVEIARAIKERVSEVAMTAEEVLAGLAEIARGDLGDFLEGGVYTKPAIVLERKFFVTDEATGEVRAETIRGNTRLIKKYTMKDGEVSIELYSRVEAYEKLGKYHGLWAEKPEQVSSQAVVIFMPQNGREVPGHGQGHGEQGEQAGYAGDQAAGRPTA